MNSAVRPIQPTIDQRPDVPTCSAMCFIAEGALSRVCRPMIISASMIGVATSRIAST